MSQRWATFCLPSHILRPDIGENSRFVAPAGRSCLSFDVIAMFSARFRLKGGWKPFASVTWSYSLPCLTNASSCVQCHWFSPGLCVCASLCVCECACGWGERQVCLPHSVLYRRCLRQLHSACAVTDPETPPRQPGQDAPVDERVTAARYRKRLTEADSLLLNIVNNRTSLSYWCRNELTHSSWLRWAVHDWLSHVWIW